MANTRFLMGAHQASSLEMVKEDRLNIIVLTILLLISKEHLKSVGHPFPTFYVLEARS
jgi:hypothetical protein